MNNTKIALCVLALGAASLAQQSNGPLASLTVDGNAGGPYPINISVRTNTTSVIVIGGIPNAAFALFGSATGQLQTGAVVTPNGVVDLPLSPLPLTIIDGFANSTFNTGAGGSFTLPVSIPSSTPVGLGAAQQCVVAAPTSAGGYRISAATREVVTQGPITVSLNVGDDSSLPISLSQYGFSFPFYGVNYTTVYLGSNGFLTFGGQDVTTYGTIPAMVGGLPRISGYWMDLVQAYGQVQYTVDANPGPGAVPWMNFEFISVQEWGLPATHTFSMYIDASGYFRIVHPVSSTGPMVNAVVGTSSGANLSAAPARDLTLALNAGATLGAVNEGFVEAFALTGNPYDLFGRTLNFLPSGTGALPASTNRYTMY